MNVLNKIKRLVLRGDVEFSDKATTELVADSLQRLDVYEALSNAEKIDKVLNSMSPHRRARREKLYVIKSYDYSGRILYTKGKFCRESQGEGEAFYLLISAKIARTSW